MYQAPPNGNSGISSSYPSTYPSAGVPNIPSGVGYSSTTGFGGYQQSTQPSGYIHPAQSYLPSVNQVQNSAIPHPNSGNFIESSEPYRQGNTYQMNPPNYTEATAPQSKM